MPYVLEKASYNSFIPVPIVTVQFLQPEKADEAIVVKLFGSVIVAFLRFWNDMPIFSTPSPTVMDVKLVLPPNKSSPIVFKVPGKVIVLREVQPQKARYPILVTPSGISMEVKPLQPRKAYWPMLVTLEGMSTDARPLQPEKAQSLILRRLCGSSIETSFVESENK